MNFKTNINKYLGLFYILIILIAVIIGFNLYNGMYEFYLEKDEITISLNKEYKINIISENPNYLDNINYEWSSSDDNIVSVDEEGVIKGLSEGTSEITIKSKKGFKERNLTVNVSNVIITDISFKNNNISLKKGESKKLEVIINNDLSIVDNITYNTSNENIVQIDSSGIISAINSGVAIITATTSNGLTSNCTVTVIDTNDDKNNPVPTNPTPTNPTPTNPTPSNPTPSNPTPSNPTPSNPTPSNPTPSNPAPSNPTPSNPAPSNPTPSNPTPSNPTPSVINVTGVSLNKTSSDIYLNSSNPTIQLTATVSPSNATNKEVVWSSSNPNVATVTNGKVTAISPGTADITVKTVDGNKTATMTVYVKKKVIIVIGASQVTRMKKYVSSYSSSKYNYSTANNTLIFIEKSGSLIAYQTGEGWNAAVKKMEAYNNIKNYIEFHVFFPLSGNTIKSFACSNINDTNDKIKGYAKNYNNVVETMKNKGYNVKGYVVSMHPVNASQASSSSKVVENENKNSCAVDYRSNLKYHNFNQAIQSTLNSYKTNLIYESTFTKIMNVNNTGKNYTYKITYNTDDGIHWDNQTTSMYVKLMLDESGNL